jgi:hypothetical protein
MQSISKEDKPQEPKKKKRCAQQKTTKTGKTKEPAGKTKKIRLFPNEEQRKILNKWFGTAR